MPHYDFKHLGQEKEDFTVVLPDETVVTLPKVLPTDIMLRFLNSQEELENVSDGTAYKMGFAVIEGLMGKENWDKLDSVMDTVAKLDFMRDIFAYYGLSGDKEEEEEGKDEETTQMVDESPIEISSRTSEPSTQISNGSTPTPEEPSGMGPSTGTSSSQESPISPREASSSP